MNVIDKKAIDHLNWIYPRQEIVFMGTGSYGIKFQGMVHESDLDKINQIGFSVSHIQSYDEGSIKDAGLIVTIKDRNKARLEGLI